MKSVLALAAIIALAIPASAKPLTTAGKPAASAKRMLKGKIGSVARVNIGRELRPARAGAQGRRAEPQTIAEETAAQIQKVLRGNPLLRAGVTGIYVADARTGEPLFAVNEDDPLNVASNVKLISTATAIELLGPDFRYPTRLLGPEPVNGIVKGDVYLLGSYDPTLTIADYDDLGTALAARGIQQIEGNVVVGADPTRDGIYRAIIPVQITAGAPGQPAIASVPPGFDLVTIKSTAVTARTAMRPRLTYKTELTTTPTGLPHITLTIAGAIGKDGKVDYPLWTKQRTATAAYATVAALRAHQIGITGTVRTMELGDFIGETVARGALPIELGRHHSQTIAEIASRVNKWSINWLADRLVMTAAGLTTRQPPTMEIAVDAMYGWLDRRTGRSSPANKSIVIDSGSGLSYRTQISAHEIVSVLRSAAGFSTGGDPKIANAWRSSLAVAGTDGTLRNRFRNNAEIRGHVFGKTGTLHNVIALSGILDVDPQRPLAFALVTNTDTTLSKPIVRRAHEQVVEEICKYLAKTSTRSLPDRSPSPAAGTPVAPTPPPVPSSDEVDETVNDDALDRETVDHK